MAIIPVTIYGDEVLRKKTKPVKEIDSKTVQIIKDMFDTMRNADGIGLAANQIGFDLSIFVVDLTPVEGYEDTKPLVMINPKIVSQSEELEYFKEGCLSVPMLSGEVLRPEGIEITYFDTNQKEQKLVTNDFFARVIQHEYDHLQGILFTDKVDKRTRKNMNKSLMKITQRDIEIGYPITEKK